MIVERRLSFLVEIVPIEEVYYAHSVASTTRKSQKFDRGSLSRILTTAVIPYP